MQIQKTKLPEGSIGIAELMGVTREEIKACSYYPQIRTLFKDYNLSNKGAKRKAELILALEQISSKCNEEGITFLSAGVDKAIEAVRYNY